MGVINQAVLVKIIESDIGLSIIKGQLHYSNKLANVEQIKFIQEHREKITLEILKFTNQEAFRFKRFTAGEYGLHKKDGICMVFENILDSEDCYTIFNVSRKKTRNSKSGKKGDLLKGNKFIVSKNFDFYKLWLKTGLKLPTPSDFHRYMGNLKPLLFIAQFNHETDTKKMQASSIKPLNIFSAELIDLVSKSSFSHQYHINNESINAINKEKAVSAVNSGLKNNSTACRNNCENKLIRKKKTSKTLSEVINPIAKEHTIQQSNEEWLAEYNNTSIVEKGDT